MKTASVIICICAAVFTELAASDAVAQPVCHDVHHWYVDTDWGPIGYRDTEINGSYRQRSLELGPFDALFLTARTIITGVSMSVIFIFSLVVLSVLHYRGLRRNSTHLPKSSS